jgi:N-acetylglucosamine kinase-like BadF-type ATPase
MECILGIDGGATKTFCVIADIEGRVIAEGEGKASNYHVVGIRKAKAAILEAVGNALSSHKMKLPKPRFKAACFGLAGLDSPNDRKKITNFVADLKLSEKIIVVHDSLIALYGATLGEQGVILIAGTGQVAAGKNKVGMLARSGNWGHIIGDEGSAYDMGRKAMVSVIREYDGRGPSTLLTNYVKCHLHLSEIEEILDRVYAKRLSVTEIAGIAPLVVRAAKERDKVALDILGSAVKDLALSAITVIKKLGMENEEFRLGTMGGVFKAGDIILVPFKTEILKVAPKAEIITPKFKPAMGAIFLALERLGIKINEESLQKGTNSC